ncbi:MAG: type II toxin-antitoxin system RelE/ParE family toxin [Leptolyngbya sp. BL-A-14]
MDRMSAMPWEVLFYEAFESEFDALAEAVQDELLAKAVLLATFGPALGRPHVDTLKGSRYRNMKELRFNAADGVWRVAFAFDVERRAILLVAGDKSGGSQKRFYKTLIQQADERFERHLKQLLEHS